jgi:hypothetical protein
VKWSPSLLMASIIEKEWPLYVLYIFKCFKRANLLSSRFNVFTKVNQIHLIGLVRRMFVGRLYLIYLIFNLFILNKIKGNDHEVDFQEIEISIFQEVERTIRRSKV